MLPSEKVTLNVYADDGEAVEINLLDGQLRSVASGSGFLNLPLEPGIYTLRAVTGGNAWKTLVVLEPGKASVQVHIPRQFFSSPAPLEYTIKTHEYHRGAVAYDSRQIHATIGQGSAIFLSVREFSGQIAHPRFLGNPLVGLSLLDGSGNELVDFAVIGMYSSTTSQDPIGCCNVVLDPGYYWLRQRLPLGESVDLGLVASPGWQTQVFALLEVSGAQPGVMLPNLVNASILMTRFEADRPEEYRGGYREGDEQYQRGNWLAEIARLGLTNRRAVLRREIYEMLHEKFDNPMLGILGAHLLLAQNELQPGVLEVVVGNLRNLVGVHPDVEALALALPGEQGAYRFDFPPMVRRGWSMVAQHSATRPNLVPPDSVSSRLATHLWGEEPWNLWYTPLDPQKILINALMIDEPLSSYEIAILQQITGGDSLRDLALLGRPELDGVMAARLVELTELPRATVEALLDGLVKKAGLY